MLPAAGTAAADIALKAAVMPHTMMFPRMFQRPKGWGFTAHTYVLHALSVQTSTLQPYFAHSYMSIACLVCLAGLGTERTPKS